MVMCVSDLYGSVPYTCIWMVKYSLNFMNNPSNVVHSSPNILRQDSPNVNRPNTPGTPGGISSSTSSTMYDLFALDDWQFRV